MTASTSEARGIQRGPDLNPSRTPFDKKKYRTVLLPNGLRALLIHDVVAMHQEDHIFKEQAYAAEDDYSTDEESLPGLRNAAVAVVVGCGSFFDPPECQGLAHFLEHLLFLGSSRYPGENDSIAY